MNHDQTAPREQSDLVHIACIIGCQRTQAEESWRTYVVKDGKRVESSDFSFCSVLAIVKPVLIKRPLKKKTKNWFSRPIIAKCRSKVLQNAPREHSAILWTFIFFL